MVDEVWREGYSEPHISKIYGLKKLQTMFAKAMEQTKSFPCKSGSTGFYSILKEVDRILEVVERQAQQGSDEDEDESYGEMADCLEDCMDGGSGFDRNRFSKDQESIIEDIYLN
ncbi:MAG: hypothetical protein IPH37_14435 [Burkholderiales bacterium]|nr:hypothetical protein [Burkholderiales bacterium]